MSSAIPYDPDDFDNNPFATESNSSGNRSPSQHDEEQHQYSYEEPVDAEITQQIDKLNESFTDSELKQLIPERYITKYYLKLKLIAIEKNGNQKLNPILKFNCQTNLSKFRSTAYKDIRRTYTEVTKFNKYLNYSNLEVFVPQLPPITTSFPQGSEDEYNSIFTKIQHWFDQITSNLILIHDEEFVFFVENGSGYSVLNINKKQPIATGVMRKALKQFQPPYDSYLELAEFRPLIKSIYLIATELLAKLEKVSKLEKFFAIQLNDLSLKFQDLSNYETNAGMRNMWVKFAQVLVMNSDLSQIESIYDMGTLADNLKLIIGDSFEIKESLTNRHLIMRELIQAQQATKSKHLAANKIRSKNAIDPIKVDETIRSLETATKFEENLTLQLKRISAEMILEKKPILENFEKILAQSIKDYTLNKIKNQRKILSNLENIRIDVRVIDENGGLSRLNRSNLSKIKHNLNKSQSLKGDSWSSRAFRSIDEKSSNESSSSVHVADDVGGLENAFLERKHELNEEQNDEITVDARNAAALLGGSTF